MHVYHIEHCYVRWFWQSYLIADCIVRGHKVSSQTSVPVQRKEAATISTISCALSARGAGNALCEVLGKFIYIYIRIYIYRLYIHNIFGGKTFFWRRLLNVYMYIYIYIFFFFFLGGCSCFQERKSLAVTG